MSTIAVFMAVLQTFFYLGIELIFRISYEKSHTFFPKKCNRLSGERIEFTYVIFAVHLNQIKICHEKELDLRFI